MRLVLSLIVTLTVLLPTRAWAADVHGDDAGDRYVGTGGVILPASVGETERRAAADCADCAWRLSTPCVATVLGNAFGDPCGSVVRGCPGGELLRAWRREGAAPWRDIGLVCLADGPPLTVEKASRAAHDAIARQVPALAPAHQPRQGVLVQLPTAFATGQDAGPHRWAADIVGSTLGITATPTWLWVFGDGATLAADRAGGPFPSDIVHVYRRAGRPTVTVTTTWSATFTVDGLGPFPVAEPVRQTVQLAMAVGEGRALLTPSGG